MLESPIQWALLLGLLSAASLPIGALVGVWWRPSNRVMAFLLAFGGGALLAALTIELMAPGIEKGLFNSIAVGAVIGGLLFKVLDYWVNQKGGYLRKPSTAINFWSRQTRQKTRSILAKMRRLDSLKTLSTHSMDKLASITSVREYPAGAYLYRVGDHPAFIYVIESGSVELSDPRRGGRVFETLQPSDVFGRLSFYTGLHRKTEARIKTPVKLLCLPRQTFFDLLPHSEELREHVVEQLQTDEVKRYLEERHFMAPADVESWVEQATEQMLESGELTPPLVPGPQLQGLPELLAEETRMGFFHGLSLPVRQQIASRMANNTYPRGFVFFNRGDLADRCYLLRQGTVSLVDVHNQSRDPIVVNEGELFGAFSFLTAGPHTMTAIGHEETQVSELRSEDFQELWLESTEVRHKLSALLKQHEVEEYLTEHQQISPKRAGLWLDKAAKSMSVGEHFPSIGEIVRTVATQNGAPMAVFLGILLDGIPESLVIGADILVSEHISWSLIGGLFLSNFPEALSSSAGMKDQGFGSGRVVMMWSGLMLMTGVGAALGVSLLEGVSPEWLALIKGIAAGAMLTMIAETMLPEAYHNGSGVVGLSTLAGFLAAVLVNQV
jgi:CRP-like cAMP-binding protein